MTATLTCIDKFSDVSVPQRNVSARPLLYLASHKNDEGLVSTFDAHGHVHAKDYNAAGQVITQTDPLGHKTEFQCDTLGRLQRVQSNWGKALVFERNDHGSFPLFGAGWSVSAKRSR